MTADDRSVKAITLRLIFTPMTDGMVDGRDLANVILGNAVAHPQILFGEVVAVEDLDGDQQRELRKAL